MDRMPLPPETFFAGTPFHVRAYIEQLHTTIAELHSRMTELETSRPKTRPTPLYHPRPNTLTPNLPVLRPSRYAAVAASLATPSTNGLCSPPSNASASSLVCRRPAAAALHP